RRNVIAANDAFLQRAGQSRRQVLGQCCRDGGACNVDDCPTQACLRSGGRHVRICERRNSDGRTAWEEVHASPVLDSTGKLIQVVEVWRDISDRRDAEARLADSHRLASLGMLASGFSHELNTPLATVLTCVEGILRDVPALEESPDAGRIRESATIAREQVLRCRGTTQHFLRLARGRATPGGIVDLRSTIQAVARLIEPTGRAHSVSVDVFLPEHSIHIRVDEADLQHALVNLLLNAIQASKAGGRVSLRAEEGDPVRIRIEDQGCGIPEQHLKHIFEPFYSVRAGGTGLGLFLSLNFVRRAGGDIEVKSTAGSGSTFEILLPAVPLSGEAQPQ
ncbi:MAG: PAS domain-containing protein, partial [Bryobacterales bacterium]|nr:PAS domain-containing protein [Bryobacterales bacterium]